MNGGGSVVIGILWYVQIKCKGGTNKAISKEVKRVKEKEKERKEERKRRKRKILKTRGGKSLSFYVKDKK